MLNDNLLGMGYDFTIPSLYKCCVGFMYRISKHRDLSNRIYASDEARAAAIEKAENLQSALEPDFPTFIKSMLQSHVTGGFWLVSMPFDYL